MQNPIAIIGHNATATNRFLFAFLIAACLVSLFLCTTVFARQADPVWHQSQDKGPRADSRWASVKNGVLKVCVEHSGGIGKTELVLEEGQWPPQIRIVFRHFKALEGFKIWTATKKFEGAISASNKKTEIDLGKGFIAKTKGDFIYIYVPKRFIKENEQSIHVEWVDFYR